MTSRPLTVLLVLEATAGGTARHLVEVADGLHRRGVRVHVACALRRDPAFRDAVHDLRRAGIPVVEVDMHRRVRPLSDCVACVRVARLVRALRPDIVHLHSTKAGALGRITSPFTGPGRLVYSPHAFAFLDKSARFQRPFALFVERALSGATDHLVAVSQSEADLAVRHRLVTPSRVTVVRNGVDPDRNRRKGHARVTVSPIRVGFLGRLERQKAPMRILDLADALRLRGIDFRIDIAGTGALAGACAGACRLRKLEDRVRFLGHVSAIAPFYESLDLFVTTSSYEGLPYSVLDAMAFELPVIGFDVPGVSDVVRHSETGLLVPPYRVDRMADLIGELAARTDTLTSMGAAGRKRVLEEFRLTDQIDGLLAVYKKLSPG